MASKINRKFYIEAYDHGDRPLLADFHGIPNTIIAKAYKHTPAYKALLEGRGGKAAKVAYWTIVSSDSTPYAGKEAALEVVENKLHTLEGSI